MIKLSLKTIDNSIYRFSLPASILICLLVLIACYIETNITTVLIMIFIVMVNLVISTIVNKNIFVTAILLSISLLLLIVCKFIIPEEETSTSYVCSLAVAVIVLLVAPCWRKMVYDTQEDV